jgi:hypothetical protein
MATNLRSRLKDLQELKSASTTRKRYLFGDKDTVEEPVYNIKELDKKCVEIHNALFLIDRGIKESNAKTDLKLEIDYNELMEAVG